MHASVVLGLVFSIPSQEIGLGERLRNDLFCVEWDVKPQLNPSTFRTNAVDKYNDNSYCFQNSEDVCEQSLQQ